MHLANYSVQSVSDKSVLSSSTAVADIQSQEAYELACRGPLRPDSDDTEPYIYGVKCIHFKSPNFTLGERIKHRFVGNFIGLSNAVDNSYHVFGSVGLSVCLFVDSINQKVINGLR